MQKIKINTYHRSKLYNFLSKTIPYYRWLPFKNKRQRVKCRTYFRFHWISKVNKHLVKVLKQAKPISYKDINIDLYDLYWEIKHKHTGA